MAMASPAYDPRALSRRRKELVEKLMAQYQQQRPNVAARMGYAPSVGTGFRNVASVFRRGGGQPQLTGVSSIARQFLASLGAAIPRARPEEMSAVPGMPAAGGPRISEPPWQGPTPLPPEVPGGYSPPPTPPPPSALTPTTPGLNPLSQMRVAEASVELVPLGGGFSLNPSTGEIIPPDEPQPTFGTGVRGLRAM